MFNPAKLWRRFRQSFERQHSPHLTMQAMMEQAEASSVREAHADQQLESQAKERRIADSRHIHRKGLLLRLCDLPISDWSERADARGSMDDLVDALDALQPGKDWNAMSSGYDTLEFLVESKSFQADNGNHYLRDTLFRIWRPEDRVFAWAIREREVLD